MKDGNTQRRNEEAMLCIACRETLTGGFSNGALGHRLSLSYEMPGDYEPLYDSRYFNSCSKETRDLAAKFTKALEDEEYHSFYLSEESMIGSALVSIVCRGPKDAKLIVSKMKKVAKSVGVKFKHVKANSECHVACSVTPIVIPNKYGDEAGYKIRMSYTCGNGNQPLSFGCNTRFVDKYTYEFGYAFTTALRCSDFYELDTLEKSFQGYDLMSFECYNEDLEAALEQLHAVAIDLGCKLSFIAFSGGPGFNYPHISLREYQIM